MSTRISPLRRAQLAKIHIAKEALGLDDDTYRAMLRTVAGVTSAKDLDSRGCASVLEHMKRCGFVDARRNPTEGRPHNTDSSPQLKKIEALLTTARRAWAYADGIAKRMFGVDRVAFCNPEQLGKIIAALSIDQGRRQAKSQRRETL